MKIWDDSGRIQWRSLIESEAVFIAALPLFGSLFVFVYEAGYFSHFNVPVDLVRVDLNRVVVAIFSILAVLSLESLLFSFVRNVLSDGVLRSALKVAIIYTLPFVVLFFMFPWVPNKWLILICLFLIFCAMVYLTPLFMKAAGKSYIERLGSEVEKEFSSVDPSPSAIKEVVVNLIFALGIVFSLGRYEAERKVDYLVLEGNMVVIRNYGDMVVLRRFDSLRREMSGDILVKKFDGGGAFSFAFKSVGPVPSPNPIYRSLMEKYGA